MLIFTYMKLVITLGNRTHLRMSGKKRRSEYFLPMRQKGGGGEKRKKKQLNEVFMTTFVSEICVVIK
jgi:hypothetical protein